MVWVKGSLELRKEVRYLVHMMILALGWKISCIHITRLSNCWSHVCKKQNPSYFDHPSVFPLYIFLSTCSNPSQFAALIFLNQPTLPSTLPYPTRKRGRTQGSIKKGENFITPNLEDAVENDDTTMTHILRGKKTNRHPIPPHNVKRKVIFSWKLFDMDM